MTLCGSGEMHQQALIIQTNINDKLIFNNADHDWFQSGNADSRRAQDSRFKFTALLSNYNTFELNKKNISLKKLIF